LGCGGDGGSEVDKGGVSGGGVGEEEWEVGRDGRGGDGKAEGERWIRRCGRWLDIASIKSQLFSRQQSVSKVQKPIPPRSILSSQEYPKKNIDTKYSYTKPKS